jgi:flagellar motility protein MotE (MotC chaperone)
MRTVLVVVVVAAMLGAGFGLWHRLQSDPLPAAHNTATIRSLLEHMSPHTAAAILSHTSPPVAASLLLAMPRSEAEAVLASMPPATAAALLTLINQEGR